MSIPLTFAVPFLVQAGGFYRLLAITELFSLLWKVKGEGTISLQRSVEAEWAASPDVLGNSYSTGSPEHLLQSHPSFQAHCEVINVSPILQIRELRL